MVPEGWQQVTVDKLCKTVSVGIVIRPAQYYVDENFGVRAFRSMNVREGFINNSGWVYLSEEGNRLNTKSRLDAGDVLVVRSGAPGTACVVTPEYAGSNCIDVIFARPEKTKILSEYLCAFTNSTEGQRQIRGAQGGLAQKHLNVAAYKRIELPLPPLSEQRQIISILATWDRAIETTKKLIKNSKAQKNALVQRLLSGKMRFVEHVGSSGFKNTEHGKIPIDWDFLRIVDIAQEITDRNSNAYDYPVVSCSKHHGFVNSLEYFKKQVFSQNRTAYKIIRRGQFGFPSNHIEEGSIGYQDIHDHALVSPIYCVFAVSERVDHSYLYNLLKTDRYRQLFSAATNASVDRRGSLRWKEFSKICVPLPSLEEQAAISSAIAIFDRYLRTKQSLLAKLRQEKSALMQQLLTGKRRVHVTSSAKERASA
jgi:type I restriction enzyme S subunit